jgi:hypothetical protein
MRIVRILCSIVLAGCAASCAAPQAVRPAIAEATVTQEEHRQSLYVLERRTSQYTRVYNIAQRLSRANADLCRRTRPTVGLRFENINDYESDLRPAARELWDLSENVHVAWVGEETPAARAGVRLRDRVIAINGRTIAAHRNASRRAFTSLRDASEDGPVTLSIVRGAETIDITVLPEQDCAYQFVMVDDESINAVADGRTIYFFRGMMRFAQSDEEIALIVGHELAHNAMGHIEAGQQNATMGMLGGALLDIAAAAAGVNTGGAFMDAGGDVGRAMFSQEFESEADYVGMYFMARAGYSVDGVEEFWRRMSAENPRSIRLAYTHPSNATRFVGLAATREEIAARVAAGQPLRPRMRGDAAEAAAAIPASLAEPPASQTAPVGVEPTAPPESEAENPQSALSASAPTP